MTHNLVDDSVSIAPVDRVLAPLREQVTATLRHAILDFTLKPGQRLIERELIEQLGVSRTTVREALRELVAEGLVSVIDSRGAIVAVPSVEDAVDLYEIRAVLEALLARQFVERADDQLVSELFRAVDGIATETLSGEMKRALAAKEAFYEVVYQGAHNPILQQVLTSLKARVQALRALSLSEPGRSAKVVEELRAFAEAVGRRDAADASALFAQHVRNAAASGLTALREGYDAGGPILGLFADET